MKIEIKGQDVKITTSDDVRFCFMYSHVTELLTALNIVKELKERTLIKEMNLEV